jgi:hypothetical protein
MKLDKEIGKDNSIGEPMDSGKKAVSTDFKFIT